MKNLRLSGFLSLLCLFLLTGCASVSVSNIHPYGSQPERLPDRIYVRKFTAPLDTFHLGKEGAGLLEAVRKERTAFAKRLVARLSQAVAPAFLLRDEEPAPTGNFWLIEGVYDRVNAGNRGLRMGIGFGAGGTKMETRVRISTLSFRPPEVFLKVLTTGGSGMAPGAVAAFTPAMLFYWPGAVANAGGAALSGIPVDRDRTAREISAVLAEYCHQRGWLRGSYRRPKRLGEISLQSPVMEVPNVFGRE